MRLFIVYVLPSKNKLDDLRKIFSLHLLTVYYLTHPSKHTNDYYFISKKNNALPRSVARNAVVRDASFNGTQNWHFFKLKKHQKLMYTVKILLFCIFL